MKSDCFLDWMWYEGESEMICKRAVEVVQMGVRREDGYLVAWLPRALVVAVTT